MPVQKNLKKLQLFSKKIIKFLKILPKKWKIFEIFLSPKIEKFVNFYLRPKHIFSCPRDQIRPFWTLSGPKITIKKFHFSIEKIRKSCVPLIENIPSWLFLKKCQKIKFLGFFQIIAIKGLRAGSYMDLQNWGEFGCHKRQIFMKNHDFWQFFVIFHFFSKMVDLWPKLTMIRIVIVCHKKGCLKRVTFH